MASAPPKEKVLEFVKTHGPVIPLQIKRALGGELLFIGAILSELRSKGQIKATHLKYGGTPFYYCEGQEERLQELIKYLNEKDKETIELLRNKKVLRDSELTPLQRVGLRKQKDFAIPLYVRIQDKEEIFWKWFLVEDQEAEKLIKEIVFGVKEVSEGRSGDLEQRKNKEEGLSEEKVIEGRDARASMKESKEGVGIKPIKSVSKKSRRKKIKKEELLVKVKQFLEKKDSRIVEVIEMKPTSLDLIVEINTPIGKTKYFCRVKYKKNVNDGDLAAAYLAANAKKMPLLFIAFGSITKKAKELAKKEFPGAMILEEEI